MRYSTPVYRLAQDDVIQRDVRRRYIAQKLVDLKGIATSVILNYSPLVGYRTHAKQQWLKENRRHRYGSLDPNVSTITSATIGTVVGLVGLTLDGFDVGSVSMVREGFIEAPKYVSWIGSYIDPLLPFDQSAGFPKWITQTVSYTLITDGVLRIAANLGLNKPLGFLPVEAVSYGISKLSKKSASQTEVDSELAEQRAREAGIDAMMGGPRIAIEKEIAAIESAGLVNGQLNTADLESRLEALGGKDGK